MDHEDKEIIQCTTKYTWPDEWTSIDSLISGLYRIKSERGAKARCMVTPDGCLTVLYERLETNREYDRRKRRVAKKEEGKRQKQMRVYKKMFRQWGNK